MKAARLVAKVLHIGTIAGGAFLAMVFLTDTQEHFRSQSFGVALGGLTTGLALLALCAAYAYILLVRGFAVIAVASFMLSYPLLALVLDAGLRAIAKDFAPADSFEAHEAFVVVYGMIWITCLVSVLGVGAAHHFARPDSSTERTPRERRA